MDTEFREWIMAQDEDTQAAFRRLAGLLHSSGKYHWLRCYQMAREMLTPDPYKATE